MDNVLEDKIRILSDDVRELAENLLSYLDIEYKDRDRYPHIMEKYTRDAEIAVRVLDAIREGGKNDQ